MKYLFDNLDSLAAQLTTRKVYLFLDYDGTLVELKRTPEQVVTPINLKPLLTTLSQKLDGRIAIISGRSLASIQKAVDLPAITCAGSHGFDLHGPGMSFSYELPPEIDAVLSKIKTDLFTEFTGIENIRMEDKRSALAVNYSRTDTAHHHRIENAFSAATAPHIENGDIRTFSGNKFLEVLPAVDWHKGKIVDWLLRQPIAAAYNDELFPIYIGDEPTDEHAFAQLQDHGLTIRVGPPRPSHARYYLNNPAEVHTFLANLADLVSCANPFALPDF